MQRLAIESHNLKVGGSSPPTRTKFLYVHHGVPGGIQLQSIMLAVINDNVMCIEGFDYSPLHQIYFPVAQMD